MSSLSVAAGVTVVVAAGLVAVLTFARRRRRTARPEGPRTVADLVRLRSEAAGRAVGPGSTADDTPHPTASTAAEIGPAATPVAGGPAADATGVDTVSRLGGSGDVAPAAPTPAAGTSAGGNGSGDTPWARARLLAGAQDEPVADNVAACDVPVVPEGSVVRQEPDVRGDLVAPDASAAQPEPPAHDEPAAGADRHGADQGRARVLRLVTPPRDPGAVVIPAQSPPAAAVPAQRGPVDSERESAAEPAVLNGFGALRPSADDEPVLALSGVDDAGERSDGEPGPARLVRFRVVRRDGSVVGGACVSLLDGSGREVVTGYADTRGCGELRAPRPARYLLVSTAPDHQPAAVTVSTVDGAAEAELSLIRSASMVGSVRGNRGPIIGARLTLVADGENVDSAESGFDGGYRLRDLAAGAYRLFVDAAGCLSIALPLDIADGAQLQRDIELEPTHRVVPPESDVAKSDVDESGVERLMIGNG